MHEYDLIAEWYASDRNSEIGVPEVTSLASSLPRVWTRERWNQGGLKPIRKAYFLGATSKPAQSVQVPDNQQ